MLTRPQSSSRNARGGSKGGKGGGKGAFLLPITPLVPLRRDRERDDWGRVRRRVSVSETNQGIMEQRGKPPV